MSGHLSENWISRESGSCSNTTTPAHVILPKIGLRRTKVMYGMAKSKSRPLNPTEMLWKDLKQAVHRRNTHQHHRVKVVLYWGMCSNSCKLLCRTDQQLQETLPAVIAAKGGHTKYREQRFTYFATYRCATGSFFSINKWQAIYFWLYY